MMLAGLIAGVTIVVAVALFVGGIAVGCWLQHDHQTREGRKS